MMPPPTQMRNSRYISIPTLCASLTMAYLVSEYCERHDHGTAVAAAMYLGAFLGPIFAKRVLWNDSTEKERKRIHQNYLTRLPKA